MSLFEIKNLHCGYGSTEVIKGISLTVAEGEIVSITGPNGCGKSTLLKAACGLIPIMSGGAYIDGVSVSSMPVKERAKRTAMLSQTGAGGDYSEYTVFDTIMMGRYARHKGGMFSEASAEDTETVERCISEAGLSGLEERLITELSGGQLQRVFLARAFAQEPDIIFLDEPANHLDLKHQTELYELLHKWTGNGKSAIGVFHDLSLAAAVSDRIMLMQDGRSVLCGEPREILRSEKLNEVFETDVRAYMKKLSEMWNV